MCELFGFSAKNDFLANDMLKTFYKRSSEHPHGWGLSYLSDGDMTIEKESLQASKSNYLKELLSVPIASTVLMAHIRYATIGNVDRKNCHPYCRRDCCSRKWILIHNGTIFDYPLLDKYFKRQCGETDSERILMHIVHEINRAQREKCGALNFRERFTVLDNIISHMAKGNKLNLIIYDGEYMYVHTNYRNSLYYLNQSSATVFATYPLTNDDWQNVPFTTLLAVKDGRIVSHGTDHGYEYTDNAEAMKHLYQIFSGL